MLDHPWPFSEAHGGPKMAQNSTNMAQNITKMALHDPKCPYMTPSGPKTLPMGILHDILSCWTSIGGSPERSGQNTSKYKLSN